jgi:hypothetical protein
MVKQLSAEIEIAATPERVWAMLTEFAAYPTWNPFIPKIEGTPVAGTRLAVRIEPPGGRGMTFRPTVVTAEPNQELRWLGRLLLPGIFDGEHRFRIEPLGTGRIRFIQAERFSGLLVPVLGGMLSNTEQGFQAMNQALKERAEATSAT